MHAYATDAKASYYKLHFRCERKNTQDQSRRAAVLQISTSQAIKVAAHTDTNALDSFVTAILTSPHHGVRSNTVAMEQYSPL